MVPLNAALRKNRLRITEGRPAAIRSVPGGSNRGVTTSSPTTPRTAAPVSQENTRTWSYVPSWSRPCGKGDQHSGAGRSAVRGAFARVALGVPGPRDRAALADDHGQGHQRRRDHHPEDQPPCERRRQPAGERRADQGRQHPGGRHPGEHRRAQPGGVDAADDDVEHDDHQPRTEAGDRTPHEQDGELPGQPADRRAPGEEQLPRHETRHGSGPVGPHAGQHDAEQLPGEHHREREPVAADRAQLLRGGLGIAVAIAMNSNATIVTMAMTATEISRYAGANTPGAGRAPSPGSPGRQRSSARHPRWCSSTRV